MKYFCPNCSQENTSIICTNCQSLISTDIDNYFDLFQTTGRLDLSQKEIDSFYYAQLKKLHPDLFQNKPDSQKELSLHYSNLMNNAYKSLSHIFKRADYFAKINDLRETSDSIPKEILMDVFEVQDLLEKENLTAEEKEQLEDYYDQFSSMRNKLKTDLEALFKTHDEKVMKAIEIKEQLNDILDRSSYIERLLQQIDEKVNS